MNHAGPGGVERHARLRGSGAAGIIPGVVLPGQFLERPALVDAGGVLLEGLYHRGTRRPSLLVCPAPGAGGGMEAPVVAELAWAAARAGHASLRFQHRGEGASQGEADRARRADDAEAAYRHLAATAGPGIAVAAVGAGLDAGLALARAHPEISRVVLVAPDRVPDLAGVAARVLALVPERDAAVPAAALEGAIPPLARLLVVPEADPSFRAGLPFAGQRVAEWISARGEGG